ncbi:hypothetical protein KIPB_013609, partial [Kipferlia bialata]|eukprot:g13609.t1
MYDAAVKEQEAYLARFAPEERDRWAAIMPQLKSGRLDQEEQEALIWDNIITQRTMLGDQDCIFCNHSCEDEETGDVIEHMAKEHGFFI